MILPETILNLKTFAQNLKVVVIGDAMLDKYITGTVDRISPEAPVPVVNQTSVETKVGGAANVAMNFKAWGCETHLIAITGKDDAAEELRSSLESLHIRYKLIALEDRITSVKTRIVSNSHHLLRIDHESKNYLTSESEGLVLKTILEYVSLAEPEMIILEDYNKGLLTDRIIRSVVEWGKTNNVFVGVDPKETNFFSYEGVDLFKPNLREAAQAAGVGGEIEKILPVVREWRKKFSISSIAVTLGNQGIHIQNEEENMRVSPEKAIDVVDVCGAGDAVISVLALALHSGLTIKESGDLANLAGAYVCTHSGVIAVDPVKLAAWI